MWISLSTDYTRMINALQCVVHNRNYCWCNWRTNTLWNLALFLISINKLVLSYLGHTVVLSLICVNIFSPDVSHTFLKGVFTESTGVWKRSDSCPEAIESNGVKTGHWEPVLCRTGKFTTAFIELAAKEAETTAATPTLNVWRATHPGLHSVLNSEGDYLGM